MCAPEEDVLTTVGVEQAKRLGVAWKHLRIDYLYASTLIRAQQTASILSEENEGHPAVIPEPDVVECYFGEAYERGMHNGDFKEVRRSLRGYSLERRDYHGDEGGESMIDVNVRARKWIISLMMKHGKEVSERPACSEERRGGGEDKHDSEYTPRTTSSIEDIPEDLPHIVVVSQSFLDRTL
jgi:broad specificity phosphatase PhoE